MNAMRVWSCILALAAGMLCSAGVSSQTEVIDPQVQIRIRCADPNETLAVIVSFDDEVEVRDGELRAIFESLGATDIVVLWIIDSIAATVPAQAIPALASRLPGVKNIRLDEEVALPPRPGLAEPVSFAPPLLVDLGVHGARRPLLADFNGGGRKDALIPYSDGGAHVGVYLGEGELPFGHRQTTVVGMALGPVALGDFNEDGIVDLVVGAGGDSWNAALWGNLCGNDPGANNRVPVFLGNGDGLFQLATCLVMETSADNRVVGGLAVVDFNEDCHDDIAVSSSDDVAPGYVATFFGNADGTFSEPWTIEGLDRPGALYAGYFNGDAHRDLLVVDDGRTTLYAGDGLGNFALLLEDPRGPKRLVGDVNSDKVLDLIVYDPTGDEMMVLVGNGDGSFADGQTLSTGDVGRRKSVQLADLNGDGHQDLLFVGKSSGAAYVLFGDSTGRFPTQAQVIPLEDGAQPIGLGVDDLNNDGRGDLFVVYDNGEAAATGAVFFQTVSPDTTGNPDDTEVPSVPAGLRLVASTQTTATLAWDAASDNVGVASYRLYEYAWSNRFVSRWSLKVDGIATLSVTVTELGPGSIHRYAVSAVDAAGNESARSATLEVGSLQPPIAYHPISSSQAAVFAVVGEPFVYDVDAIGVPPPTFSLVAGPPGMSVDAVSGVVQWIPAAGDEGTATATATATVRASNSEGSDDHTFSFPVHPAGTDRVPPSRVGTPVATDVSANGATLSWKPATDNVGVAGYLIWAQKAGRGNRVFVAGDSVGTVTRFTVAGLTPHTSYRVWVAAYDAAGNMASISGVVPVYITTHSP